jgi:VWFA-related protein
MRPHFRLAVFASLLVLSLSPIFVEAQGHGTGGAPPPKNTVPSPSTAPMNLGPVGISEEPQFTPSNPTVRASDEGKVDFKTSVVLVQLPVVVRDKAGKHVVNLKKEDFQILESGKEQKIASLEEVVASKSTVPATKPLPGEFSNLAATQGEQPRSITVVALDTVNTPMLDQTYARKQLLKYLAQNADPNQAFGLVIIGSNGLKIVHGLTGDFKQLIEALNKVSSDLPALTGVSTDDKVATVSAYLPSGTALGSDRPPPDVRTMLGIDPQAALEDFVSGGDQHVTFIKQEQAIETTMQAFLGIAWSLSGFPGKKSIIWATGGMPFNMDSPDAVPGGYLSPLYERTMATLNESNIAIYPVDVKGVLNDMPAADPSRRTMPRNILRPNNATIPVSSRSWLNAASTDTLRDFAAMTGGKAYYNNNDIADCFKRAVDDSSSYYLVGYYLDTKNTKSGWRKLKVTLRDKDKGKEAEVRARSGFFVTNATMNPDVQRRKDLDFAVLSPFDSTGLPMTVRWLGMSPDGTNKKVQFGLQLPSNALTLGPKNLLAFDYSAMAYTTKDGKQANSMEKSIQGNVSDDRVTQLQAQGLGFKNEISLAPGAYTVRFVVRDDVTGKVGSVTAPITVN